jgi:succinate dehydrogenase / fumarate reductase flavoprotein subunit
MIWNTDLMETLELDNLIGQAAVTVVGAAQPHGKPRGARPRGLRRPQRRQLDEAHARPGSTMSLARSAWIDYRPVHNFTMTDDIAYIPPKARVY